MKRAARLTVVVSVFALAACNALLGIDDVTQRKADSGTSTRDGSDGTPDGQTSDPDADVVDARPSFFEVASGNLHTCAKLAAGSVQCWGDDQNGQLGINGDASPRERPFPVAISDAVEIAAGKNHTCVVRRSGKVSCWGLNLEGQLGDNDKNTREIAPRDVANIADAVDIAAGANFTCAVRATGEVNCWGANASGQLGNGTNGECLTPCPVKGITNAVHVTAGALHACAIKIDGSVSCWGDGTFGQLGNGGTSPSTEPVDVQNVSAAGAIAAGDKDTCALLSNGTIRCWGANDHGQLGNGTISATPSAVAVDVLNVNGAFGIGAGASHACALHDGGAVCWGLGDHGQLGDGVIRPADASAAASFVSVNGQFNGLSIRGGTQHTCAPLADGKIFCWGSNDRGQLGNGTFNTPEYTPVTVVGYP